MMRGIIIVASFSMVLSGCIDSVDSHAGEADAEVCIGVCALAVDASERRSFESSIARNPVNPDNIVIGASAWRGTGEASGPVIMTVHTSFDGGATFETRPFLDDMMPGHPLFGVQTFADPWVVFLPDGTALFSAMVGRGAQVSEDILIPGWESFDIAVARSTDGGRTWPEATLVSDTLGVTGIVSLATMNDQPFMAVTPDGQVFMTWILQEFAPDGSFTQDVVSSVSTDGGVTWSGVVPITDGGTFRGGLPAATADGGRFIAMRDRGTDGHGSGVFLASSGDGGLTWTMMSLAGIESAAPVQMAAHGSDLFMVHGMPDGAGIESIHLRRSIDGGATWIDEMLGQSLAPGPAIPALAVTLDGTLFVSYYLVDAEGRNQPVITRIRPDGERHDQNLTTASLQPSTPGGVLGWYTYGDYQGLWADKEGAVASWLGGVAPDTDLMATLLAP